MKFTLLLPLALFAVIPHAPAADNPKTLVTKFVQLDLVEKKSAEAFEKYARPDNTQHNPAAPDGAQAAVTFLSGFHKPFPQSSYEIKRVIAEDTMVMVHAHARITPDDKGMAVVDIFRVEDGRVAEHWDVIQAVPEKSANPHAMF